jgi:2'-5' RNA ligase
VDRNDSIRTFICIELPDEIRDRIGALQDRLKHVSADVSWVRPAKIHLTLKFLGDVGALKIARVCAAVENAIQGEEAFPIEVGGTGCFPSAQNPRILWIGVASPSDKLKQLQTSIEKTLEAMAFARENRPFSAHLTLGRVKSRLNARRLVEELAEAGSEKLSFQVSKIAVMRSDLKAKGAVYTPLASIPLIRAER